MNYAPGPYKIVTGKDGRMHIRNKEGCTLATVFPCTGGTLEPHMADTAKLMAHAGEMYQVLQDIMDGGTTRDALKLLSKLNSK